MKIFELITPTDQKLTRIILLCEFLIGVEYFFSVKEQVIKQQ